MYRTAFEAIFSDGSCGYDGTTGVVCASVPDCMVWDASGGIPFIVYREVGCIPDVLFLGYGIVFSV
jgi:hypothetical protein